MNIDKHMTVMLSIGYLTVSKYVFNFDWTYFAKRSWFIGDIFKDQMQRFFYMVK